MGAGTEYSNDILDQTFNNTDIGSFGHVWVALHTGDPGNDGANNEVSVANGYGREDSLPAAWGAASARAIANTSAITMGPPTGSWGDCTYVSLWKDETSKTAANFIGSGALDSTISPEDGDTVVFAIGDLSVSLT